MAIELQVCKNDLHNTRLLATESGRLAEWTAATLAQLAARPPLPTAAQAQVTLPAQPNRVYTVRFEFGSSRVVVPADIAAALVVDAKDAPLVLLRGRTDGAADSAAESRIARDRALAMRDHLVAAGVDPARVRATWQPAGNHVADNTSPSGRALNRRVEIEVYRVPPVAAGLDTAAQP